MVKKKLAKEIRKSSKGSAVAEKREESSRLQDLQMQHGKIITRCLLQGCRERNAI